MDLTHQSIEKAPTGIKGLDEIVAGGLPRGRTTLLCGGPGSGKTLLATEFLVRGAELYDEPGVFVAFEETPDEMVKNVASLGIDLQTLIEQKKIYMDYVYIERSEIEETGEYNLEGLFIRLGAAIDSIGAKRVVLDTIETIFAGFANESILRSEIRRLFRWMKNKGVTAVVTGERGEKSLTRYGLEEYVSDCVILLDNRVNNKSTSRLLRVVKYRGSQHGTDEYPFLISDEGIWVQPITSLGLNYASLTERISSGVAELDQMLDGKGHYRATSILVSGMAGTGKSSLAVALIDSACRRGERCLYFSYEESPAQIIRNMRSIGFDLEQWVNQGLLRFHATRPTFYGIEMHLLTIQKDVEQFNPSVVVIDPLNNLIAVASEIEVNSMLVRLIDHLKMKQVSSLFTSLTNDENESSAAGVSSLMDTWITLRNLESNGERNRLIFILKARGMAHSSQVREFLLTDQGIDLMKVDIGPEGVLVGSARAAQKARENVANEERRRKIERRRRDLERRRRIAESRIAALQAKIEAEEEQLHHDLAVEEETHQQQAEDYQAILRARHGSDITQK